MVLLFQMCTFSGFKSERKMKKTAATFLMLQHKEAKHFLILNFDALGLTSWLAYIVLDVYLYAVKSVVVQHLLNFSNFIFKWLFFDRLTDDDDVSVRWCHTYFFMHYTLNYGSFHDI